ncbi:MAG: hypothetical protein IMF09_12185 [Proteobacteria bacterium]|nr:hypothetical protein [Pseudomonadota bacterium]
MYSVRKLSLRQSAWSLLLAVTIHLMVLIFLIWGNTGKQKQNQHSVHSRVNVLTVTLPVQSVILESKTEKVDGLPEISTDADKSRILNSSAQDVATVAKKSFSEKNKKLKPQKTNNRLAVVQSSHKLRSALLQQLQSNHDAANKPELGKFTANKLPDNWTRKAVDYTPGMFKGAERKQRISFSGAVVVESWRGTDGSFNTKMQLANGKMICGSRALGNAFSNFSASSTWVFFYC